MNLGDIPGTEVAGVATGGVIIAGSLWSFVSRILVKTSMDKTDILSEKIRSSIMVTLNEENDKIRATNTRLEDTLNEMRIENLALKNEVMRLTSEVVRLSAEIHRLIEKK